MVRVSDESVDACVCDGCDPGEGEVAEGGKGHGEDSERSVSQCSARVQVERGQAPTRGEQQVIHQRRKLDVREE